ncbi:Piso0_004512 [Millerozyma farinosa CBS 7064]|uniref:Piso0_004512 protein n=1 Tax=Pichia sorbitophila (strain ATCC MYA-4447 / BCRC 22081 / CBS 7064 / NBRC 10061 / NRRL Y-12695) TaxID=559304 RepID=G8Y901_PICSO|nr:Piso0_004512 [Millerozyma farinosa CBS 7064]CCE84946.1 Piso0_004512 [Millerozyma farinosa CBS 7064]
MSEIESQMPVSASLNTNPVHPNAKSTTHVNNGTTTSKTNMTSPVCRNCKTQTTPLWRRDERGEVLCNACGLFLKLHGRPRPISLKTDTIKSRNRMKQPNSARNSGPNTPELKSKDSKVSLGSNGKKSPKMKKKGLNTSPDTSIVDTEVLTPLLPASTKLTSTNSSFSYGMGSMNHIPHNLQHHTQPLHYPSSTPTHFAPGLQRITSPLLLSNSSVSNTRSSSNSNAPQDTNSSSGTEASATISAVQAAGALENMSNELGPSATFKPKNMASNGVSLINKDSKTIANGPPKSEAEKFSTPSSALNAASHSVPVKLPSIGASPTPNNEIKPVSSPSFGPQFHLHSNQNPTQRSHSPMVSQMATSLPPISQVTGQTGKPTLPNFQNSFNGIGSSDQVYSQGGPEANSLPLSNLSQSQSTSEGFSSGANNKEDSQDKDGSNKDGNRNRGSFDKNPGKGNEGNPNDSNNAPSNPNQNNSNEVNRLKTRISELELVNDLYRTRIMELEAMEQAARIRELSMRKRLDEYHNMHGYGSGPSKTDNEEQSMPRLKKIKTDS